ncbi:hypothetical protein ACFVAF_25140 [Streptomyces sp. NPDC057596]|uniref:hypothetical protein n=1 Tax=Streptomyces sp. NPDC057596 TaxID=3346178 RepID=UPI0036C266EE
MTKHLISYLTGGIETITADQVDHDVDARIFVFYSGRDTVALVPAANVLSIVRQDDEVVDK